VSENKKTDRTSGPRRALITGASTGLGRDIALAMARAGYNLALTSRDIGRLDEVMAHPDLKDVTAVPIALELKSEDSIEQGFKAAVRGLGGLDVLVNNAARTLLKPAVEVTWEEWDDVVNGNLKGAYFLSCRFARHCMDEDRGGAIINIASTHGMTGFAGRSVYGTSKGGMIQMTRMLGVEWAEQNICVNAIAPTLVLTESRAEMHKDPAQRARMLARIPMGRCPEPSEISDGVLYLAGPGAISITGHTLVIDGGLTVI